MKKPLATLLLVPAAVAALAVPAGAAVPDKPADRTVPCPDGPGAARIWSMVKGGRLTKLAADNPCDQWLPIELGQDGSGDLHGVVDVAPRAHFNRQVNLPYQGAGPNPASGDVTGPDFGDQITTCDHWWDNSWYVTASGHGVFHDGYTAPWCG